MPNQIHGEGTVHTSAYLTVGFITNGYSVPLTTTEVITADEHDKLITDDP